MYKRYINTTDTHDGMNIGSQAVYRIRSAYRDGEKPAKYRRTYEVTDEASGELLAVCDLIGRAVFDPQKIRDENHAMWEMKANRKVLPTRWSVSDPEGRIVIQFNQKTMRKLVNPLTRVVLAVLDRQGKEMYRVVYPGTNILDRILGSATGKYTVIQGKNPVANLVWLSSNQEKRKGIWGRIKRWLRPGDRGVVSLGASHILPAPVVLCMDVLIREVTEA